MNMQLWIECKLDLKALYHIYTLNGGYIGVYALNSMFSVRKRFKNIKVDYCLKKWSHNVKNVFTKTNIYFTKQQKIDIKPVSLRWCFIHLKRPTGNPQDCSASIYLYRSTRVSSKHLNDFLERKYRKVYRSPCVAKPSPLSASSRHSSRLI